mgnify:CR=1 FL=1
MMEFFACEHCGEIAVKVKDQGAPLACCGQPMKRMKPGVSDGAAEKHVPAVSVEGDAVRVQVGEAPHPMLAEHWIEWIALETDRGFALRRLHPGEAPKAGFRLAEGERARAVYEFCNLHGLWKADI